MRETTPNPAATETSVVSALNTHSAGGQGSGVTQWAELDEAYAEDDTNLEWTIGQQSDVWVSVCVCVSVLTNPLDAAVLHNLPAIY